MNESKSIFTYCDHPTAETMCCESSEYKRASFSLLPTVKSDPTTVHDWFLFIEANASTIVRSVDKSSMYFMASVAWKSVEKFEFMINK